MQKHLVLGWPGPGTLARFWFSGPCSAGWRGVPAGNFVVNSASAVFRNVYGNRGKHKRSAGGMRLNALTGFMARTPRSPRTCSNLLLLQPDSGSQPHQSGRLTVLALASILAGLALCRFSRAFYLPCKGRPTRRCIQSQMGRAGQVIEARSKPG
jgi:hypothetical protein